MKHARERRKESPKGQISLFVRMKEDKELIRQHLAKGGNLKELREKGIKFAQPI